MSRLIVILMALVVFGCANVGSVSHAGKGQHKTMTARLDKVAAPLLAQNIYLVNANTVIFLTQDDRANASTDGEAVYITTGLISRIGDLALALVVAHELGHISLGHISLGHYWSADPPKRLEQEADRYGLFLLARAGLDYQGAAQLPAVAQSPHKSELAPSADEAKRAEHFRSIIAEIETLKARGAPLIP